MIAQVQLWGRVIGAVYQDPEKKYASFQYDPEFLESSIEVSPIAMPLNSQVYEFPELSRRSFHGLPGLLADSLPDRFGNALIDAWLATQGREPESFNSVERLCYTGSRGMGALEFYPSTGPGSGKSENIQVERLVELASEVLQNRDQLRTKLNDSEKQNALREILSVGTSAGGARAKAVIAWNPDTNEVRSGQIHAGDGFEYWLLKFDGVSANRDKELADPKGYGVVEYAYSLMAKAAGIQMYPCRLLEENGRRHFMTRRFDRSSTGSKVHMQSLAALGHYDFNMAGAHSYEEAAFVMKRLGLGAKEVEELFRRMVFNIVARNQDDHVKNIAFLMDKAGVWKLAPAFDLTYSFNPSGAWTHTHQMSLQGKRDNFTQDDFISFGKATGMKRGAAKRILNEVVDVVSHWQSFASRAGLDPNWAESISNAHRVGLWK